jgi:hypothetical protein
MCWYNSVQISDFLKKPLAKGEVVVPLLVVAKFGRKWPIVE